MANQKKKYGTGWLKFWVYFRLPLGILLSSLLITANIVKGMRDDYFSIPFYTLIVIIDVVLVLVEIATLINMYRMTETGYGLNHVLLVLECLSMMTNTWVNYGIINPLFFLLWWLPNFVYFRHRKYMFSGRHKITEIGDNYTEDPAVEVIPTNSDAPQYKYRCNNCGMLCLAWHETCPRCGSAGKMEETSHSTIQVAEHSLDIQERQPVRIAIPSVQDQKPNVAGTVSTQRVDNRIVFICPNCDSIGLDFDIVVDKKCQKCGAKMIKTGIKSHSWNEMTDSQKEIILKQRRGDKPKEPLQKSTVDNTLVIPNVSINIAEEIIKKEVEVTAEAEEVNETNKEKLISVEKTCLKCGAVLPPDAKFCAMCGEKVEKPKPKPRFCRFCGSKAVEGSLFCHNCGQKLLED